MPPVRPLLPLPQFLTSSFRILLPRPTPPVCVDPAELVRSTASKAKADAIKTWAILDIDKNGMKGTLGIGNGAVFFVSEADKARFLISLVWLPP
jgi:hypothetical protein